VTPVLASLSFFITQESDEELEGQEKFDHECASKAATATRRLLLSIVTQKSWHHSGIASRRKSLAKEGTDFSRSASISTEIENLVLLLHAAGRSSEHIAYPVGGLGGEDFNLITGAVCFYPEPELRVPLFHIQC